MKNIFDIFKKFLIVVFIIFLMSNISSAEPLRVVHLPTIVVPGLEIERDIVDQVEVKISRALFIPAIENFQGVEYIPSSQSKNAMRNIFNNMQGSNTKSKLLRSMKPLAQNLNADFVVCAIIYQYEQKYFGSNLQSEAAIDMIIFDNRTDELINKNVEKNYNDLYKSLGTADSLLIECVTNLIDELQIKNRLMNHNLN